jgi:hypothetical protein
MLERQATFDYDLIFVEPEPDIDGDEEVIEDDDDESSTDLVEEEIFYGLTE